MKKQAFFLLDPLFQEELRQMKWTELRPIQTESIYATFETDRHILISANTASGKTEAAFLPILSKIIENKDIGISALYIGPLKALINDQFRRLEDLCKKTGIPVHRWHGDIGQAKKKNLLLSPSGVLLITPESIESLFINHPYKLELLFGNLAFIVIDELHSFIGNERGAHLKSLISRVVKKSKNKVRQFGLSATIGDMSIASKWICPNEQNVKIIKDSNDKEIKLLIKGYLEKIEEPLPQSKKDLDNEQEFVTEETFNLVSDITNAFYGKTSLIFANSKSQLEFLADLTARILERGKKKNLFRIHHGSLSKEIRESTEEELKSNIPIASFCSSTLELGIDVGNIKAVGQIGHPWTVNSLLQRMGRSGRKDGETSVLWIFIQESQSIKGGNLFDRLFLNLIQAIAQVELMRDKWCEPPEIKNLHISTLVQQIMSKIAETGGINTIDLYDDLVKYGAFNNVSKDVFIKVLKSIGAADLIEQTPEGLLILGIKGEAIVRKCDFYAAFKSNRELKVIYEGKCIGMISGLQNISVNGFLILAGRRWRVVEIVKDKEEIIVRPSKGGRVPLFHSDPFYNAHPAVHKKMYDVLTSGIVPMYLDTKAKSMLASAQIAARDANVKNLIFIQSGIDVIWFTWAGSKINNTLYCLGQYLQMNMENCDIALVFYNQSLESVKKAYSQLIYSCPPAEAVIAFLPYDGFEKYEEFLSQELQAYILINNKLDIEGAIGLIKKCLQTNGKAL